MNKTFVYILLLVTIQTGFAQIIPTLPAKPGVDPQKPAEGKTKIIYVDKSKSDIKSGYEPKMIEVQGGSFDMGSNDGENEEKPVHRVTVSSFKMSQYEITVAQYRIYCKATGTEMPDIPDWGWKENHPIVNVSYDDASKYCNWLSKKTGREYRLPTEAEWEFAARGGNKGNGYNYSGGNDTEAVAWYTANSGGETQPVGRKKPNELGLYDMSGNAKEWCKDWYDEKYYNNSTSINPKGPSAPIPTNYVINSKQISVIFRIVRGGGFISEFNTVNVSFRDGSEPDAKDIEIGFRVVSQ